LISIIKPIINYNLQKIKIMKKLISLLFIISFCLTITSTNAQTNSSQTKNFSPISGAWLSADHKDFMIMNDGFFSSVSQDSTGIWRDTHAGTYTIDNANTITLKVLYSSYPDHIGALNTIEYDIKGEALTMKWFKKLIDAKGVDITAQMPKDSQTQYIRAKK
jgi:hypothetical protein